MTYICLQFDAFEASSAVIDLVCASSHLFIDAATRVFSHLFSDDDKIVNSQAGSQCTAVTTPVKHSK